jgi:outer membrane protein assembly factor BamD (BamD/ComL family)
LADELRVQADKHRNTVRNNRIEEIISQIDELLDQHQWSKASVQIEGLINAFPDSEHARAMRQRLYNKKEKLKKELLSQWDAAVQRQDTDKSLNILKELDHYLTPNEALALQEAAKDVFRTKLHNLGVRFSMAVSDRNWTEALDVGQQIIADFPNSRMSEEIRAKLDVLKQNVQNHA